MYDVKCCCKIDKYASIYAINIASITSIWQKYSVCVSIAVLTLNAGNSVKSSLVSNKFWEHLEEICV